MKTVNVGINGFGRIGKVLFRILVDNPKIDLVAINDPMDKQMLMHLLKYDTVHGKFAHESKLVNGDLLINGKTIKFGHWNNPSEIPWSSWGVDTVVESSGLFTKREGLQKHIDAGAKRVILSCPPDDEVDFIALMGVNHHKLTSNHRIISNASCTANSVAPILQILNKEFGVETAFLNTVHPYTNNQRIMDSPHSDYRRARASGANIIPTSTSAIRAIHTAMPEFKDRFHGISTRVPIPCGALSELVITFKSQVTATTINKAIEKTNANNGIIMNLALNYGSRNELIRSVKKIAHQARKQLLADETIDESLIEKYLDTAGLPDPDLLIRTSGEKRISNFLLWQAAYAELYFTDTLWPDFRGEDLLKAIHDFQMRNRRFGGL